MEPQVGAVKPISAKLITIELLNPFKIKFEWALKYVYIHGIYKSGGCVVLKFAPWGNDPFIEWDESNEEKVWNHGISSFEIEECFGNVYTVRPHNKAKSQPKVYGDRFLVRGVTDGGRGLVIIVQYKGSNVVRPITAWDE